LTTTLTDEALLMAYVDGELTAQQRDEVEQMMRDSPETAEKVALLMGSALPYKAAFERQAVPPVPASLILNVNALVARHAETHDADPAHAASDGFEPTAAPTNAMKRPVEGESWLTRLFGRPKLGWLAVAFATGAACYGLVLQAGVSNLMANPDSELKGSVVAQAQPSAWVRQAASYQQLYSRDTLGYVTPDTESVTRTVADIREIDGLALRIPDLSAAGLTFKRVQRLRFNNKPLVQLVYTPQQGDPVALCVMKEPMADQSVAQMSVSGMNVVVWRQSELGYALIGAPNGVDLKEVARLVVDRRSGQLFTAASPSPLWVAVSSQ
jgi:anti-sigma factor RsiW